jgi:hypothetical protein
MARVILAIAMLVSCGSMARANQKEYPPLNRETLVGTWQGLIGIGTHPVVFHIVIAARDMRPNQALERTVARREFPFQMIKAVSVGAELVFSDGRSACSRYLFRSS